MAPLLLQVLFRTAIRRKGALKKCIVHHVTFAALTTHNPVPAMHAPYSSVRLDRRRYRALIRVYQQWPMCSKESHTDSSSSSSPSNAAPDEDAVGSALNRR
jgi:hypothetical protein